MATRPVLEDLPIAHFRSIGRLIFHHARLEWHLRRIVYLLLDVDPKRGRIAVREPRAADYLSIIKDLIAVREIDLVLDTKELNKAIVAVTEIRNGVAHGIWLQGRSRGVPMLQATKGSWGDWGLQDSESKTSLKIDPAGIEMHADDLPMYVQKCQDLVQKVKALEKTIKAALPPSPDKQPG